MLAPSTFRRAGGIPVAIRAFILGGILIGLWLGLRRTGLEGRVRTVTWLAIAVPLFAWHLAVWQFARSGGFESRWSVAGAMVAPIPFAISVPLLIWIPALWRSQRARRSPCLERARDRRPPRRDRDRRADHERPAGGRNAEHRDQKPSPGDDPRLRRAAVAHPPRTVAPAATALCAP